MGLSFRKSLSFGPMRFNLSGSGVGASIGVRGLRVGMSPRGTYVSAGTNGIYYRKMLSASSPRERTPSHPVPVAVRESQQTEITSGDVLGMEDATSSELLEQLNQGQQASNWLSQLLLLLAGLLVLLGLSAGMAALGLQSAAGPLVAALPVTPLAPLVAGAGLFLASRWARRRYLRRATTLLMYDLDKATEERLGALYDCLRTLGDCSRLWHVASQSGTREWKRNAGADSLVERAAVRLGSGAPPLVVTNVDVLSLPAGREHLYFMPDRLLVYDRARKRYGAVAYGELEATVTTTRFIESGAAPPDAQVIDTTWAKVNRDGSPDRRFRDNRELPVCRYGELLLESPRGLREMFMFTRPGAADGIVNALGVIGGHAETSERPTPHVSAPTPIDPKSPRVRIVAMAELLRYVAVGDRRFTEDERSTIEQIIVSEFPNETWLPPVVGAILDECKGRKDMLEACLGIFRDDDEMVRRRLVGHAEALAAVDGKGTPSELKRVAEVRAGLRLSVTRR